MFVEMASMRKPYSTGNTSTGMKDFFNLAEFSKQLYLTFMFVEIPGLRKQHSRE